jgi:hypothetical protein
VHADDVGARAAAGHGVDGGWWARV